MYDLFLFLETRRAKLNERSTSWDSAIASASGITRRDQELQKKELGFAITTSHG